MPNGKLGATPPHWMTPLQGEYWRAAVEGAPPDLLRLVDGATLAVYAVAAALHQQATEAQAAVELSPDGMHPSPYLRVIDAAGARLLRAIGELGFSPSSRPRFCQPVRQLLVIVGRDGYARALCEGMTGDALPRMPIDSRQGTA